MGPPRLALWLLETSKVEDALAGDILEQLEQGRSAAWLWREVVAATWAAAWRCAPAYRRSWLTGALGGLTASWVLITAASQALVRLGWLTHAAEWAGLQYAELLLLGSACTAVAAWIVARAHASHPVAALVGFAAAVMAAPLWKLPFIALFEPAVFMSSIAPHLAFLIPALLLAAPLSILLGGRIESARR